MSNQPMFSDPAHPDVSLRGWEMFKSNHSPFSISKVIDRASLGLEPHMFPLARGGVVLTDYWLQVLGFQPGKRRAGGWVRVNARLYERAGSPIELIAQRLSNGLWMPLRCDRRRSPLGWQKEAFVHVFGASPVLTTHVEQAIYLAERYGTTEALFGFGLRWAEVFPTNLMDAVDYASKRNRLEWRASIASLIETYRDGNSAPSLKN